MLLKFHFWGGRCLLIGVLVLQLMACTVAHRDPMLVASLPPLQTAMGPLTAVDVLASMPDQSLLFVDEEMKSFIKSRVPLYLPPHRRVELLYRILRDPSELGLEYSYSDNVTAAEAYHLARANCLGFANLFIALARELDLQAYYQLVHQRPEWRQRESYIERAQHINVVVPVSLNTKYVVDIGPQIAKTKATKVSDRQALALYYSNQATLALSRKKQETAYRYLVKAISLAADMKMLWVNLGVLYRQNNQMAEAKFSYLQALTVDENFRSAHYNLAVLYAHLGELSMARYHEKQIERYQQRMQEQLLP